MRTHYRNPTQALKQRIREAAFSTFMEKGYAGTNTREIAARAKVSKRELNALYDDKQAMLADCIRFKAEPARPTSGIGASPGYASPSLCLGASELRAMRTPEGHFRRKLLTSAAAEAPSS